jgi:Arc-like DNA binding domain
MNDQSASENEKFVVRLPSGLRDRIKEAAAANNRSMNAEIVDTLEQKYPRVNALDNFDGSLLIARVEAFNDQVPPRMKKAIEQLFEDYQTLRTEILRRRSD